MRHLVLALALAACSVDEVEAELVEGDSEPWADFDPFAKPSYYTVRKGDTLGEIATAHRVAVEDLQEWNGIDGDALDVDQVLLIWKADPRVARTAPKKGTGRVQETVPTIAVATVVVPLTVREKPTLVRNAGVLGAMDDESLSSSMDHTLVAGLDDLEVRDRSGTSSGLETGGRSGLSSGTADTSGPDIPRVTLTDDNESQLGTATVKAPRLATPAPKACLAGPSGDDLGDSGMVTAVGLSERQIRGTLDSFVRYTSACIPPGSSGTLTVTTEMTVGCDGRVSSVTILSSGGAPSAVTACIAATLSKAGFPAHDLPYGMSFVYPISFRF